MISRRFRVGKLSLKLTVCLIGGMVIIFAVLGYQIITLHRQNLEESTYAAGDRITDIVKRSTRFGMMHNRSDEIDEIVSSIGSQPGIETIRIFNKAGVIRFSTDAREVSTRVDKNAEACYACHVQGADSLQLNQIPHELSREERTRIFNNGQRTLSVINPIENEPNCSTAACHAHSPDTKILGMINVRMSLAPVDAAISASRRQMVQTLLLSIVALSAIFAALIWLMVYKPVHQLIIGTKQVAAGDLDYKINITSRDEVGELARSFNQMTGKLKVANVALNDWAKTLEERVEQKSAELGQAHEHILRVEKLASIGKLAAIVAHEINNPLAGILVYAKLLLKRLRREEPDPQAFNAEARQYLETIIGESARCGEIVKGLLQFSRQTKANVEPQDINEIIRQSVRLVQHKIDLMSIRVEIDLDDTLNEIVCDGQQIKQALVALLINACEAVPAGEGVFKIKSKYLPELRMAELSIGDNGVGMDEETKKQIFEPFFTTKEQGKGVGLGLAVVYGIVTGHGGVIEVLSEPGEGTTFILRLPEHPHESAEVSSADATQVRDSLIDNSILRVAGTH